MSNLSKGNPAGRGLQASPEKNGKEWCLRQLPTSTEVATVAQAVSPDSYPVRRLVREHGEAFAHAWISLVLEEADSMIGAKTQPGTIASWGRMLLQQFSHRSVESICLAIRDGMTRKVYGALTYPQIAEWMSDHEAAIMALVESETARHRFTGDNLGSAYLDDLQRGSDGNRLQRANARIAALEKKLRNND